MNESILVPRAYDPSGLRQESRALGATISGMRHRCRCAVSRITRIRLFPLFFHNGCSQSSQFLPQARRIVGSGDENAFSHKSPSGLYSTCVTSGCLRRRLRHITEVVVVKTSSSESMISRTMKSHTNEHTVRGRPTLKVVKRFRSAAKLTRDQQFTSKRFE